MILQIYAHCSVEKQYRLWYIQFVLPVLLLFPLFAWSAAQISVEQDGDTRQINLDTVTIQSIEHVSLPLLVSQLGGTAYVGTAQIQLDIRNTFAVIGINTTRVSSPNRSAVYLNHPVVLQRGDVYIAASDVPLLLNSVYSLQAQQTTDSVTAEPRDTPPQPATSQDVPAQTPPPQRPEAIEEGLDLLTSLEPLPAPTFSETQQPVVPELPESAPQPQPLPAPARETPQTTASQPTRVQQAAEVPALRTTPRTIVIDVGHGGNDLGYVVDGLLPEKDITLAIGERLARILKEKTSLRIFLTRSEDRDLSMRARISVAQNNDADLFVSIHAGASPAQNARGVDIVYHQIPSRPDTAVGLNMIHGDIQNRSRSLAEMIEQQLTAAGLRVRSVNGTPLRLFRELNIPGVLIEAGVLSNQNDAALLMQESYQEELAAALAAGIQELVSATG